MRLVIAEDSAIVREGLVRLVEEMGHEVIAAVASATELLHFVRGNVPDVIVSDIRMPPGGEADGLRAVIALRAEYPGLPSLLLSQYAERSYAEDLLADGARGVGYLLKDRVSDLRAFARTLETIADGGTVLDPELAAQLVTRRGAGPLAALSPREREVLTLMAAGRSNLGIQEELFLSEGAVEKHISSIFTKLDLAQDSDSNRRVLAVLAWLRAA